MTTRIIIVGCGKAKGPHRAPARELYTGSLFRAARAYAEASGHPWLILSARHGLVEPATVLEPYDHTATLTPEQAYAAQSGAVYYAHGVPLGRRPDLRERFRRMNAGITVIEVHAGARYAEPLAELTRGQIKAGYRVECPLAGLQVGQRLAWYAARRAAVAGEQLDLLGEVA